MGTHLTRLEKERIRQLALGPDGWSAMDIYNHPTMWALRGAPPHKRTIDRAILGLSRDSSGPSSKTGSRPASNSGAADDWAAESPAPKHHVADLSTDALEALRDFDYWCRRYEPRPLYECQRRWIHHVDTNQFAQILAGPRSGKTEVCSTLRTTWHLCGGGYPHSYYDEPSNPLRDMQVGMVAKSQTQAGKNFAAVSARLQHNEKLISDYGRFRDPSATWQESMFSLVVAGRQRAVLSGDFSLTVVGVRSSVLGRGFDRLKLDDIADLENCRDVEAADAIIRWLRFHVFTRLNDPSSEVTSTGAELPLANSPYKQIEMMPWLDPDTEPDEDAVDLPPIFASLREPSVIDWGTKTLNCPERWTWRGMMSQRSLLGTQVFECTHQQNAAASGFERFSEDWIHGRGGHIGCVDRDRGIGEERALVRNGVRVPTVRVASVDPSPTKFCGALLMDVPQQGTTYAPTLLDIRRERLPTPAMMQLLRDWHRIHRFRVLILEKNSADFFIQTEEFQTWRQQAMVRVFYQSTTGVNKNHSEYGFDTLAPDVEGGRIRIPWGDLDARYAFQPLINEMLGRLPTNDLLLALWFPKWWLPALRSLDATDGFDRTVPGAMPMPPPRLEVFGAS